MGKIKLVIREDGTLLPVIFQTEVNKKEVQAIRVLLAKMRLAERKT